MCGTVLMRHIVESGMLLGQAFQLEPSSWPEWSTMDKHLMCVSLGGT